MKTRSFWLLAILLAFILTACSEPSIGNHLIVKTDQARLVSNWNAVTYDKPISCTLTEGTEVEVVDVSTLINGSSDHQTIYQVKTMDGKCTGWGFPDFFKSP